MKQCSIILPIILTLIMPLNALRSITFDDLYSYKQVGSIALAPDGESIAFEVTEYDQNTGISHANLWLVQTDGGMPFQFTHGGNDTQPCWSADGNSLVFISERSGSRASDSAAQVWLIPVSGGEAYRLTNISTGADKPLWFNNGSMILFQSRVYPECTNDDCNRERDQDKRNAESKAILHERLLFRHKNKWYDEKRNHLILYNIETGEYTDLTPFDKDVPPIALSGGYGCSISPDGSEICFAMNTDTVVAVSTNNDIFTLSIKGRQLTRISGSPGCDCYPAYSPDGRYIAYLSMARAGFESDQKDLLLYDRITKTISNLTEKFDRSINEFVWGPFSKHIYLMAIDKGKNKIYRLSIRNTEVKVLVDDGVCRDLQVAGNGNYLYYRKSTAIQPYEIYEYNNKNGRQTRLTAFSDSLFSNLALTAPTEFRYEGAAGDTIRGLITLPPDFNLSKKYPLALLIHGGPQWCWLEDFNYYGWNTQLMAAQDYVIVQIDPHGSLGYGQAFVDAVTGDWGGKPYQDMMLGIDHLLNNYNYLDSSKMAALGRSYGGYLVNWIAGQTDRFACLISVDGVFDPESDYYSTDELWFSNWEFGGPPWVNKDAYLKYSPSEYVDNFKTPTLVIHGQNDYRVDLSQGIMMFTALQARSVPSKFLYFPDEGHSLRKINNIRYFYEVQFDWLVRWLK